MSAAGFIFKNQQLYCENVACLDLAEKIGTPCYVYSTAAITMQYRKLNQIQNSKIFYAVKANANLAILQLIKNLGGGFDVVSLGEMQRVLKIGAKPQNIVFSGVGKSQAELEFAIKQQVHAIHVESSSELAAICQITRQLKIVANIAFRVNPDIDAQTHPYISTGLHNNKFGVNAKQALELYQQASNEPFIKLVGIACHLGSQIKTIEPYTMALKLLLAMYVKLKNSGIKLQYIDIGGGMGIQYHNDKVSFDLAKFGQEIGEFMVNYPELSLHLEPGRFIVGNAGILLTTVQYLKDNGHKKFMIIDAAMNDLIRPCLYHSAHSVVNVNYSTQLPEKFDIVGPICESADFIAHDYQIAAQPGDVLAIQECGAYAFSMASNYNSRPRPPEILVDDANYRLIRRRETIEDLFELEVF